jgi:hypothetical protein
MIQQILKQMLPFILMLGVLWAAAELLERTMVDRTIVAPPPESSP